jgi:Na+-transporting methylmalonyl-CoA/oxaloacetate decarboxylase gamma subunit
MNIDFSLFKNIDFTNRDNLLFTGIIFIAVIIILIVFIIVLYNIFKIIKRMWKELFSKRVKKSKVSQVGEVDNSGKLQPLKNIQEFGKSSAVKVMGGEQFSGVLDNKEASSQSVKNSLGNLDGLSKGNDFKDAAIAHMQKPTETANFRLGDKKIEGKDEAQKSYKEKEAEGISESLGKLKADQDRGKDTIESKMPFRGPNLDDLSHQPIKINRPKDFSKVEDRPGGFVGGTGKKDIFGNEIKNKNVPPAKSDIKKVSSKNTFKNDDGTIFEGSSEVSRRKLEHEVRVSPKVWRASKAVGLTLSPIERSKLIEEVFSPEYGVNISKKDLQTSLRKLNRKMLGTSDIKKHEKIRKEIKFFKKIGGIK